MKLWNWMKCHLFGDHAWTNKAAQGLKPSADEIADGMAGFKRYAAMYCARCQKFSGLSLP